MIGLNWNALEVPGAVIESRSFHFNTSTDGTSPRIGGFQFQNNSTSTFANELKFAAAKSVRTSIVTLASFNVLAALFTMMGVYWDSYKAAKKRDPNFNLRTSFYKLVTPADTFPFILSFGIIVQGITFAYVQSRGFESLSILDCMGISQAMLPAMFITLFTQVILGGEMAIRAVLPRPFPIRSRWILPACLALILALLVVTFAITQVSTPPNFCFASLFWLVHRWKFGVLIVTSIILFFLLVEAVVITLRLRSNANIDEIERLAAFRMVFYLATGIILLASLMPFFIQSILMDLTTQAYELSKYGMVSSVAANLTGIITGGCYVFLRTKKVPRVESSDWSKTGKQMDFDQEKDSRVLSVNSDERWLSQIQQPVTPLQYGNSTASRALSVSEQSTTLPSYSAQEVRKPTSIALRKQLPEIPFNGISAPAAQSPSIHIRQSSNVSNEEQLPMTPRWVLPAATYSPSSNPMIAGRLDSLVPPPKIRSPDGISHRRGTSLESTATVQIGLRLSNVNDMSALNQSYGMERGQVHSLSYSNVQGFRDSRGVPSLPPQMGINRTGTNDTRASTMSVITSPPQNNAASEGGEIRLSPTVYNPKKPVARQSVASETSKYDDDDAVPDPLFTSRKDSMWI